MLVQADHTGDKPLLDIAKEYIKEKYDKPGDVFLGLVHRIDRPVSGVIIFAKTSKSLSRMTKLFKEREVQKTYWAVVRKLPQKEEGTVIHYLKKNTKNNKSSAFDEEVKDSKKAELSYKVLGSSDHYHLLEVYPHTGRHHQIRVQLATIGSIIKGDLKYGSKRSNKDASIHLHARSVRFMHPVQKEEVFVTANPPKRDVVWKYFLENLPTDAKSSPQ